MQKFGERAQILVAIEEMSELTKALKYIRHEDFNQGDYDDIVESIAEERADVSIMLNQLAVIFGKNEDAETEKLEYFGGIDQHVMNRRILKTGKTVHGQLHPRNRSLYLRGGTPPADVSAFALQYVGQAAHFPETAKEAQHEHPQDSKLSGAATHWNPVTGCRHGAARTATPGASQRGLARKTDEFPDESGITAFVNEGVDCYVVEKPTELKDWQGNYRALDA